MSDESVDSHNSEQSPHSRSWRTDIIFTAIVGIVTVPAFVYVVTRSHDEFDQDFKNVIGFAIAAVGFLLIGGWYWFRSGVPRALKWVIPAAVIGLIALLVRVEDFTGDMNARFAWSFSAKPDELLTAARGDRSQAIADLTEGGQDDYPRFLGSDGRATVKGVNLKTDWDVSAPRALWRQPIGAGHSSFAIVGPYAVTQEQRGEDAFVVCYAMKTGKVIWTHVDPGRFTSLLGGDGPRATPTIYDGKVYTQGPTGLLNCLDGTSGKKLWSRNIVTENDADQIAWGRSGSPLIVDDMVVVSAGGRGGKSLVAYDRESGEPLWHRGSDRASYASPIVTNLAGQRQIVSINEDWVVGYDIAGGQPLWRHSWPGSSDSDASVSQPVPVGPNRLFLSKGYGHGCAVIEIDRDASGKFTVREVARERTTMKTKFANVVVHENHVYGLSGGILECVDVDNLQRKWKGGRYGHGQVMLVDALLLVVSERGVVALVQASPDEFRELTRFQAIEGRTWNNPALSGTHLLVRNHLEAACYELPTTKSAIVE